MATEKPTPEEKLFAVIQGARQEPIRRRARARALEEMGATALSLLRSLDLAQANRILTWVIISMSLLCLASPIVMRPRLATLLAQHQGRVIPFMIAPPLESLSSTDTYVSVVTGKDPFRIEARGVTPVESVPVVVEPPPSSGPDPQAVVADLKLVGISLDPEPTAMIEQVSSHQTYFLRPGDLIGVATVRHVLPDRVILQVGTQDVELF